MSNDDDKQSNYKLMLANLQSNKRHKKETLRFSNQFFVNMHLSKRKISIPTKNFEIFSHFLPFLINHLV